MLHDESQVVAVGDSRNPVRVLIVEDEPLIASYIAEVFAESGYRVAAIAHSGPEALAVVSEDPPRLALVDIRLAGPIDGIELACLLRQQFGVPSIFLSGLIDPETLQRATAARPLGVLKKPFLPSQVFNAVEQALNAPAG